MTTVKVTDIQLHCFLDTNHDDKIILTLDIPDSVWPFEARATAEIYVPHSEGVGYVSENFPDIQFETVYHKTVGG